MTAYAITESKTGITNALISVTRTNNLTKQVTVQYSTLNGSAKANVDYTGTQQDLDLWPGRNEQDIDAPICMTPQTKATCCSPLTLFNPSSATLGLSNATLAIIDSDFAAGHINFSPTNYTTNESMVLRN